MLKGLRASSSSSSSCLPINITGRERQNPASRERSRYNAKGSRRALLEARPGADVQLNYSTVLVFYYHFFPFFYKPSNPKNKWIEEEEDEDEEEEEEEEEEEHNHPANSPR